MERRRCYDIKCATLWLYLVLAAAFRCSAGRIPPTNDRNSCVVGSCNSLNTGTKSALGSTVEIHRLVRLAEKSGGDIFLTDYGFNPGSPRPVPQAPRGRAPRIRVPPSPPDNEVVTPEIPPPPVNLTPSSPPPSAPESAPIPPSLLPPT